MTEPGADPADPGHAAWHTRHSLPDPDGLLATFWVRLEALTAADATQIMLATRDLAGTRLIPARLAALTLIDRTSIELEMDEFRLREAIEAFALREPAAAPDEAAIKLLHGALRDAMLAFAAVQSATSLSRPQYSALTTAWWAGVG